MPNPGSGPISFEDLNVNISRTATDELDLDTAATLYGINDGSPISMDEFYGLPIATTTAAPPPPPSTTGAPSFFTYTVNYASDAGSGDITSCNGDGTNVTVYSNCSSVTGGGSCFLYNTPDVTDPAPNGWYSDTSVAWYVENSAGLVDETIVCPGATTGAPPPPTTTLSVTSIGLGFNVSNSTTACNTGRTTFYIDGATLQASNIIYTDTSGTFASQGYYSDGVNWAFFNTSTNTITDDGSCPSPPPPPPPPPTTGAPPPTTAAPSLFSFAINYAPDAGSGDLTSCNGNGTNKTVYSNCSTVAVGGSCFLYNTSNVADPAPAGWYSDGSESWYIEGSAGLVEDIVSCAAPPPPPTTLPPPSIEPWNGSSQQVSSFAACFASATNTYGFIGSGVVPAIGDTCYTTTGGGKFLPAGWYFEGGDFAALQIGSVGVVIDKVLC